MMNSIPSPSLPVRSQSEVAEPITVKEDAEDRTDSSPESAPSRIEGHDIEDEDEDDEDDVDSSVLEDALYTADEEPYWKQGMIVDNSTMLCSLTVATDPDAVISAEKASYLRKLLRTVGANKFVEETLSSGKYDVRTLVGAFGVRPDYPFPDSWYLRMLGLCVQRELGRRQKLQAFNTVDDAVDLLQQCKNIMVITGAGISTSLGIPDFRSKNTGFYSQLLARGFTEPEEVFDIHNFDEDPS